MVDVLIFTFGEKNSITVTPEHYLYIERNGKILHIPSSEIIISDYLIGESGKAVI